MSSVEMSVDQSVCQSKCLHLANPFDLGHKVWKYTTVFLATHQVLLAPLENVARDVDEGEHNHSWESDGWDSQLLSN